METKEHYYKRIEPADAHVLQKTLRQDNALSNSGSHTNNINCQNHHPHINGNEKKENLTQQHPNKSKA